VISPGDPRALADAVLHLARNPELARNLGANGRSFVENNLQWSTLVEKWLKSLHPEPAQGATARNVSLPA
jgi:glycosyltransferase involved in cell wall biosynthesis